MNTETRSPERDVSRRPALARRRGPELPSRGQSRVIARARWLALPTMAAALVLYIVLHSPLRRSIATLFGYHDSSCYPCGAPGASRVGDSLAALVFVALAVLAAAWLSTLLVDTGAERPLAFGLLALGFISVPSAALAAIGSAVHAGLLGPPGGPLVSALPAAVAVALGLRRGWRPRRPPAVHLHARGLLSLVGLLAIGMVAGSAVVSLMHPPTQGDALGYHAPLAVFLWSDGNLTAFLDRSPDVWALAHPGTAELWYGLLRVAGGARLADLGQLPFALLGAAAVGVFAWRLGLRRGAAFLAAFAFLTGPLVAMQLGMQANDVLGGGLLMATMALACAPLATWDRRRLILLGLGLGLVSTTKVALLPSVGALALFVVVAAVRHARGPGARALGMPLLVGLAAFVIVVAPWWSRNLIRFHDPIYPANLPVIGNGISLSAGERIDSEFVPRPLAWPAYPLLEPQDDRSGIGALFIVGVLPGFVLAVLRARRQPLLVWATVTVLTLPAWWTYTLHEPRFLIASFGLAFAFVPWTLVLLRGRARAVGYGLLAAAALFSAVVTLDQALIPFARQPTARAEFYDRVWGVDPVAASLPKREAMLLETGYGPGFTDYAAYYPLLGDSLSPRKVVVVDRSLNRSTADIVALMRRHGLRFAYTSVIPSERAAVRALYAPEQFELVRVSGIVVGKQTAARRYLYRDVPASDPKAFRRYLFRLR